MQKGGKTPAKAPAKKSSGSGYVPGVARPSTIVKKGEEMIIKGGKAAGKSAYQGAKAIDDQLDKSGTYRGIKKDAKKLAKMLNPFKKGGATKK